MRTFIGASGKGDVGSGAAGSYAAAQERQVREGVGGSSSASSGKLRNIMAAAPGAGTGVLPPSLTKGYKWESLVGQAVRFVAPGKLGLFDVDRDTHFAPIKKGWGVAYDSPDSARQMLTQFHASLLLEAGEVVNGMGTHVPGSLELCAPLVLNNTLLRQAVERRRHAQVVHESANAKRWSSGDPIWSPIHLPCYYCSDADGAGECISIAGDDVNMQSLVSATPATRTSARRLNGPTAVAATAVSAPVSATIHDVPTGNPSADVGSSDHHQIQDRHPSTPLEILHRKRDGLPLTAAEIHLIVRGFFEGMVPTYQMSALLMAIRIRGMSPDETAALTRAMVATGTPADLSDIPGFKVDKHSTGGVGDKTSLILAPLVAAAGKLVVPMMSGRGLGHTGGTLDKLESIPGLRTNLTFEEFRSVLRKVGACIIGPTSDVAPVDREMYALRDVTATVDSIGLITASIMSKKLSEGADGLVLDVKTGAGAFMQRKEDSLALARSMVSAGNSAGVKTVAVITDMEQPLGRAVGNWLEVEESFQILHDVDKARGPPIPDGRGGYSGGSADLVDVVVHFAAQMFVLSGRSLTLEAGESLAYHLLRSGKALDSFRAMVRAQGGDDGVFRADGTSDHRFSEAVGRERASGDQQTASSMQGDGGRTSSGTVNSTGSSSGGSTSSEAVLFTQVIAAPRAGFVWSLDALKVGHVSVSLGAGRQQIMDDISMGAGITLLRKVGDRVRKGDTLAVLYTEDKRTLAHACTRIVAAYSICVDDGDGDDSSGSSGNGGKSSTCEKHHFERLQRPLIHSMIREDGAEHVIRQPRPRWRPN